MSERKPNLDERRKYRAAIENLVLGLFGREEYPFFSGGIAYPLLDEFVTSDEVFDATFVYVGTLVKIWKTKNPNKALDINRSTRKVTFSELPKEPALLESSTASEPSPALLATINTMIQQNLAKVAVGTPPSPDVSSNVDPAQPSVPLPVAPIASPVVSASATTPSGSSTLSATTRPGQIPPAGATAGKPLPQKATFHVPNAKAGQLYVGKLDGTGSSGAPVHVRDVRFPVELVGVAFDESSGELRGTPVADGDHTLSLQWSSDGLSWQSGECLLIVNPDPRSLWKNTDPPADGPYWKANTDGALIVAPNYKIAAASRRGRSHEHIGSFRDDDFFVKHDAVSGWSVLIVADGAGSAKSSRWGSKLAVAAAGGHIAANLSGEFGARMTKELARWSSDMGAASKAMNTPFYLLFQEASKLAVQAIESEATTKGVPPKEYSTTLLAAAVRRDGNETFLATFWMGDGAIAAYGPRGKVRLMGAPDSGEYAGQTRFLDRSALNDQGFGKRIVLGRYTGLDAVILMTDGISDPRFETDNGLVDSAKWDGLWDEIAPSLSSSEPDTALTNWLEFFSPGHHDDRTIAVLW